MTTKKTVIITGACGGIGKALTHEFHQAGYYVVATDSKVSPSEGTYADFFISADLKRTAEDEDFAFKVFQDIRQNCPQHSICALVNNAAVQILGGVDTLTANDWQETLSVNLIAPFIWSQGFLPEIDSNNGCIVNVSSIHARLTKKNFVAYATSKAALSGMTKAMAVDLGPRVRVNAIEPAAIATDMLKAGFEGKPEQYQQLQNYHPSKSIGEPAEVAKLAVFLASEQARFIHGSCIDISGSISNSLHDPD